jgi:hypothetical protein
MLRQVFLVYHHFWFDISLYMITYPTQYLYFSYTHLLDVLSFCSSVICTIHHCRSNRRPVEFTFSLFETFLSQRMLDAYHHFTHPALILWLIFFLVPPSLCNIDLKYRNVFFTGTICLSSLISPPSELSSLNWHIIYSILVLLNLFFLF